MTARIIPLNAVPPVAANIGGISARAARNIGLRILRRHETQMMLCLDDAMRLELRIEELADDHPAMLAAAQSNYTQAVRECGHAMREVRLLRLQLGLPPHPICSAAEIAMGVKG